jgi:hypothetical protein
MQLHSYLTLDIPISSGNQTLEETSDFKAKGMRTISFEL